MPQRAFLFVDGFNLYHSLENTPLLKKYKWLDLRALGEKIVSSFSNEELAGVYYFTTYATWNQGKVTRHMTYVTVNESKGCQVILGRFQEKDKISLVPCGHPCTQTTPIKTKCNKKFKSHEEKSTDVNIDVHLLRVCVKQECDVVYLLSGDNDLVPALEMAKELCPSIKIRVVLPINAKAKSLKEACKRNGFRYIPVTQKHLSTSQFPDSITIDGKVYTRPPLRV